VKDGLDFIPQSMIPKAYMLDEISVMMKQLPKRKEGGVKSEV
jgi:hypothetical protein